MLYALIIAGLFIVYLVYTLFRLSRELETMTRAALEKGEYTTEAVERAVKRHDELMRTFLDRSEKERQLLINRIQDPQFAVGQAAAMGMQIPQAGKPYVTADDDQDYWRGQREMAGE